MNIHGIEEREKKKVTCYVISNNHKLESNINDTKPEERKTGVEIEKNTHRRSESKWERERTRWSEHEHEWNERMKKSAEIERYAIYLKAQSMRIKYL